MLNSNKCLKIRGPKLGARLERLAAFDDRPDEVRHLARLFCLGMVETGVMYLESHGENLPYFQFDQKCHNVHICYTEVDGKKEIIAVY